jgi:gliding motility-associated-like protein
MKKYSLFLILILSCISMSYAQTARIKRETLCGTCGVGQKISAGGTNFIIESTAGSCPGCTTLHGNGDPNDPYIRQGFEQPVKDPNGNNGGGNNPDPAGCTTILVTFEIKEKITPCGTYYDFEYTGTVEKGFTYNWIFGSDAAPLTSTELNPSNVAFSSIGIKTIELQVKKTGCISPTSKTKLLTVTGTGFSAKAQTKDILCFGKNTGEAKLIAVGGTAPFTYKWSTGVSSDFIANLKKGKYDYTVTDSKNCIFSAFATVGGPDTSIVIAPKVVDESCAGKKDGSIKLKVSGGTAPYTYTWIPTGITADQTNLAAGDYKVTITDANACVNNASFTLKEFCKTGGDNIDNTITPNGDGKNDKWVVNGLDKFPNNEVYIYNRWGSIVYSKKPYDNSWGGENASGADLPSGAYYYLIKLNDADNNTISGSITIIR